MKRTVPDLLDHAERKRDHDFFYPPPSKDVHLIYHRFVKRFMKDGDKFKLTGYSLMCAVEKWAAQYPGQVTVVGCDDSVHASSNLILIEHASEVDYMGTTVLYIPQCTGEEPIEFFLYPGHRKELIKVLRSLGKKRLPEAGARVKSPAKEKHAVQ